MKVDALLDPKPTATGNNTMDLSKLFSLHGKVALVTGASRGIGYCIAEFYAAAGATVVISSECQEDLELQAAELKGKGYSVTAISCDVEKTAEIEELVSKTVALYGQLDILVNNVGINPIYGRIQE